MTDNQKVPTKEELTNKISAIPSQRDRALTSLLYLSGARVNEILNRMKADDIMLTEKDGKRYAVFRVFTEKTRGRGGDKIYRNLPIPFERDWKLLDPIIAYVRTRPKDIPLFRLTRQHVYNLTQLHLSMNPHFLRHIRLTHLTTLNNFTAQDLVFWTGWKDSRPATIYVHLNWQYLTSKL